MDRDIDPSLYRKMDTKIFIKINKSEKTQDYLSIS